MEVRFAHTPQDFYRARFARFVVSSTDLLILSPCIRKMILHHSLRPECRLHLERRASRTIRRLDTFVSFPSLTPPARRAARHNTS